MNIAVLSLNSKPKRSKELKIAVKIILVPLQYAVRHKQNAVHFKIVV